jgi:hypothetical protein
MFQFDQNNQNQRLLICCMQDPIIEVPVNSEKYNVFYIFKFEYFDRSIIYFETRIGNIVG